MEIPFELAINYSNYARADKHKLFTLTSRTIVHSESMSTVETEKCAQHPEINFKIREIERER